LQELTTVDGTSIWAGNVVHLISNASRVASQKLMHHITTEGVGGEPANKQARLESVIPSQAAPKLPKPNILQEVEAVRVPKEDTLRTEVLDRQLPGVAPGIVQQRV
jgi:hypothetical protein